MLLTIANIDVTHRDNSFLELRIITMTGSDSTPDFSWLNKREEANEDPQTAEAAAEEVSSEHATGEEEASSTETNTEVSDVSKEEEAEKEELKTPSDDASGDSSADSAGDSEERESVFNDEGDEREQEPAGEKEGPTVLMPGRQLETSSHDTANSESPDDETVVLPSETTNEATDQEVEGFSTEESNNDEQPVEPASADEKTPEETEPEKTVAEDDQSAPAASEAEVKTETETVATASSPASAPASTATEEKPAEKSNLKFILLASYASAITLIALALLMGGGEKAPDAEQLESLPDVSPEPVDSITFVPVEARLPPGHTLRLGEKQRFGNIEVEPLRVVNEPLEFTHYDSTSKLTRLPTEPVYKLWVRFTNVSEDQEIAPLDGDLLLRWVVKAEQQQEYSNQYLFPEDAKKNSDVIATYRHSKTSDWDMKDQKLGTVLAPGESMETYIASSENTDLGSAESIIWRVQFRKGFSPSGNGVTTIFDVSFDQSDIQSQKKTAVAKQANQKEARHILEVQKSTKPS
ncbi:hypothetical protein [Thalassoglobus polymorphus]|nr:hypothetical protein [Thalassoglobus polymorphus]